MSEITDAEKARISSDFLQQSPPGEFNEVFNSVRMLLKNDDLLKDKCISAIAEYNISQFVPVKLDGVPKQTLITAYNDLGNGRFYDEVSRKSFKYDHVRKEASDLQHYPIESDVTEQWRQALQSKLDTYIEEHYAKSGTGVVFARKGVFTICIESHQFQPKNFCNGRWRSEWNVPVGDGKSGTLDMNGKILSQVHYYEDGNVQLFSEKEPILKVNVSADYEKTAKDVISAIADEETKYQNAVQENYANMSETTFKALRRQLPVTRAKMDWTKMQNTTSEVGDILNLLSNSTATSSASDADSILSLLPSHIVKSVGSDSHTTATIAFITVVIFVVAVALIAKIVISHHKKRTDLIGSARWRISASRQSAHPGPVAYRQGSASSYLPMERERNINSLNQRQPLSSLDHPTADRLDWERQFFDDSEATTPSRLTFR